MVRMVRVILLACAFLLLGLNAGWAASKDLGIRPLTQQTPYWCWAAVSEMMFKHYDVPIARNNRFQCDLVSLILGGRCAADCRLCANRPIGTAQRFADSLVAYQTLVGKKGFAVEIDRILTFDALVAQINAGDPVIAGISPSGVEYDVGMSEHAVLIVGYNTAGRGALKINDPMPYDTTPPYIRAGGKQVEAGAYWIGFDEFVNRLVYRDTLIAVRK